MPVQKQKSSLMAKYGNQLVEAAEANRFAEAEYGNFSELPGGINNGVARLVDCKFDVVKDGKDNAGEFYFYAAGIVLRPTHHGDIKVAGLRTSITEPLYATPKRSRPTFKDHLAWIQNELKKLGVGPEGLSGDRLEATAEALRKLQPTFKFSTSILPQATTGEYANQPPRVYHAWGGLVDYDEGDAQEGIADNTAVPPAPPTNANGTAPASTPRVETEPVTGPRMAARVTPLAKVPGSPPYKVDNSNSNADGAEDDDPADVTHMSLAELGNAALDSEPAQERLRALAEEAGISEEEVDAAESWSEVADLIEKAGAKEDGDEGEDGDTEEPAKEQWAPKGGDVYMYRPLGKDKKPVKRAIEVEVVSVDSEKKSCVLKNLDTGVQYKNVAWDKLEQG